MNVVSLGNTIYSAIYGDAAAQAKIRGELSTLAVLITTDPNASARVTSATVNGQTFSSQSAMTNLQRLALLRHVVACIDRGGPISTTQIPTF
ncbi:MAG: hypothetical protein RLZZ214_358 [Verrucomicrobiota bacterium]